VSPTSKFIVAVVAGLAVLTWSAYLVVVHTTRSWFDKDIALRARLAFTSARPMLQFFAGGGDQEGIRGILNELARDERIMGAAFCGSGGAVIASPEYPALFTCEELGRALPPPVAGDPAQTAEWSTEASVRGGDVEISVFGLDSGGARRGFVVLVQDLVFAERRETIAGRFLLAAFIVLAAMASFLTVMAARVAWRGWTDVMRQVIRGEAPHSLFLPLLRDVHDLVDRVFTERELDGQASGWTPERLKQVLTRHVHGEKLVVVANRQPYIHERAPDGGVRVMQPASGLVTALEPVMRACSGVWIAHGNGSADRDTADEHGRVKVPPGEQSYVVRRVWLTPEEEKGYYYGLANEGLWPLCHIAHTRPIFRGEDWEQYRAVNERFADAVAAEAGTDDPIVLVQDYHFALAPKMIRHRLPRSTVLTFWHIPWPNAEQVGICPFKEEILDGLLGSGILGFHTRAHCNNLLDAVHRYLEARIDREDVSVVLGGHTTLVRPYPISIPWPNPVLSSVPPVAECRSAVRSELGLPPDGLVGVGVDRLDYTKGIEERFLAVERLLERHTELLGRFHFIQIGAPSRTVIDRYRNLNERVEELAARINDRFGGGGGSHGVGPIVLRRFHHEPPAVARFYRAADLCYVSSLHDGMNLVAKEFVAARDDEQGVLCLSMFTGAAREMAEALIVNPYDLDEAADAMAAALAMSRGEQRMRMRALRTLVADMNVYRWAGRMLVDASRLRERDRLSGRLTSHRPGAGAVS
jgi:trehalose 6-phosphate synthase